MTENRLLNTKEAAKHLSVSVSFLAKDRMGNAKVPYVRIGAKSIRYRLSDLDAYAKNLVRT